MTKVFSLPKCGKCESAKEKLRKFDIDFQELPYDGYIQYHSGWKEDGSVDVLAARSYYGDHAVPLIEDSGKFFDYPGYMKHIKHMRRATSVSA